MGPASVLAVSLYNPVEVVIQDVGAVRQEVTVDVVGHRVAVSEDTIVGVRASDRSCGCARTCAFSLFLAS